MQIPNCIHSYRINVLARCLRSFGNDNQENIRNLIDETRKLVNCNYLLYKFPKQKDIKYISPNGENKKRFEELSNINCRELFKDKEIDANNTGLSECFYYSRVQGDSDILNKIFDKINIKMMIGCKISDDVNMVGNLCAVFNEAIGLTQADFDTLSFVSSIIHREEVNSKTKQELMYRSAFENLLTSIARKYSEISNSEVHDEIYNTLKELASFLNVDRSYLFKIDKQKNEFIKDFVWAKPGIKTWEKDIIIKNQYDWLYKKLQQVQIITINDVLHSDAPKELKDFLKERNVSSILIIPIFNPMEEKNVIEGFFGFSCSMTKDIFWNNQIKKQFTIIGYILGNALKRMEIWEEQKKENQKLKSSIDDWKKENKIKNKIYNNNHEKLKNSILMLQTISKNKISAVNGGYV